MSVSRRLEDLEIAAVEDEVLAPQFAAASRVPWDKLHPEHALSIDDEVLVFLEDTSLRVKSDVELQLEVNGPPYLEGVVLPLEPGFLRVGTLPARL